MSTGGRISIVLPLYNAAPFLPVVLPPLRRALASGSVHEVIVVNDSSSDDGPQQCLDAGLPVLASGGRLGPGGCRNIGAQAATGEILLYIDSDVVMHDDVPERVRSTFEREPDIAAVFGAYDDRPAAPGLVSRYRNLLHHFVHHRARAEASTFWAGCGAIRRAAFLEVGGFDAARYPHPSIEDIELGHRLRRHGHRIRLDREIQGTHLKRWTFASMVRTDIFRRALPWSRLLLRSGEDLKDLNLTTAERLKAVVAVALALTLALSPLVPVLAPLVLGLLLTAWMVNASFFALVRRRYGWGHMTAAVLLHQLYYLYSAATYAYCLAERRLGANASGWQ